jgi:hypothetical protein
MTANTLLNSIGQIDDKYVIEFAHIRKPIISRRTVAAIAACLLLVVTAVYAIHQIPDTQPQPKIIWANSSAVTDVEQFGIIKGHIQFSENLSKAIANTGNQDVVFAIKVIELTGATVEEVYQEFIIPLNLSETYETNGIIFASREQIATLECPEGMSSVLTLAHHEEQEALS